MMKTGFCITHEILCNTNKLMNEHNSKEHGKNWFEYKKEKNLWDILPIRKGIFKLIPSKVYSFAWKRKFEDE